MNKIQKKNRLSMLLIFAVWVLPWVIGIPVAAGIGRLIPAQTAPIDSSTAIAAALEFIIMLIIFIWLIKRVGLRLLALGALVTVGVGVFIIFQILGLNDLSAFIVTLLIVIAAQRSRSILANDAVIIAGLLGLGLYIGTAFRPIVFVGLLILLAVYDILAFRSNFLPSLVSDMQKKGAPIFVLIQVPEKWKDWIRASKKLKVRAVGTGDLFAPLLLFVSLAAAGQTILAWISALGATLGVFADLYLIQHYRPKLGMPALPTITLGIVAAYVVGRLFI